MARDFNKKPGRHKPPAVNQRRKADLKRAAAQRKGSTSAGSRPVTDVRAEKAQAAWDQYRYDEAIQLYERALARDPQHPVLLVDLARAYALRYRFADAEKLVNLANLLYPDDARLQLMLGASYQLIQHFEEAIACLQRGLSLEPDIRDRPQVLVDIASMYERLHKLDEAKKCAEEAIALAPTYYKAQYQLAHIERRIGNLEAAETCWTRLVTEKKASLGVCADSWYQLAALYDRKGRYQESFEALTRAKKILSGAAAPHLDESWAIARSAGRTIASVTPQHFDRWAALSTELPRVGRGLALLTSHPRSGTTLLEQVIDSHSAATSADELQVLPDVVYLPLGQKANADESVPAVVDRLTVPEISELRRNYWNAMEGALQEPIGERVLVDKNPELTMLIPVVARIFPEMKILFALRDPRDVVISCFSQQLPLNSVSVNYLTLEDTAKKYAKMMQAWLKLRGMIRNPWLEIRYEDMVSDLEGQARQVLEFLGLPWDENVLDFHRRAQGKHVHSPTYEAVTKPVYSSSIGRWRNYAPQLEPYQSILQPYVEAFGYS